MCSVSIIIPVYNKEENLSECLDSILSQTYEKFEVICIDDCSTDKSGEILKEYSARDERIKIISNTNNEGAGASRNKGIEQSIGEYLLILDADDIFDKDLIQMTYERCKRDDLDILLYNYRRIDNISKQKREYSIPLPIRKKICDRVFSSEDIEDFSFQMCLAAPWVKMYRRIFVYESGIRFQSLSSSNDGFFGRSILLSGGRFSYLEKSLVTYRVNTKNQISRISDQSIFNFISAVRKIKETLEKRGMFERNKKSFCSYALSVLVSYWKKMDREAAAEKYYDIIAELNDILGQDAVFLNNYQKYIFRDLRCQTDIKQYLSELSEYDYLFRYENKKIRCLKEYLKGSEKKVALWGYGHTGKEFFTRSRIYNIPIDLIVDENYIKFNDNLVKMPESIENDDFVVLTTMSSYGKEILDRVMDINKNTVLIDLQSYFTYGIRLKDCIFDRSYQTDF